MSAFTRFLHPRPAARRAYSSFFSKPGGGRYFNSHKPAKPVVAVNSTKEPAVPSPDAADQPPASSATIGSTPNPATQLLKSDDTPSSSASSVASPPHSSTLVPLAASAVCHPKGLPLHPVITAEDFQLHQFFSIHRPLLLSQSTLFQSAHPSAPLFHSPQQDYSWHSELPDEVNEHPNNSTQLPVDADGEAARQLTRALSMTRIGATVAWESTLQRLGVDVEAAANDLRTTEWNQEWEDILADSTKRKRRRKMKKHKLKKRRRMTRAERIKLR